MPKKIKKKTFKDAVREIRPAERRVLERMWRAVNLEDVYDGDLVRYLKAIAQSLVYDREQVVLQEKKLADIAAIANSSQ